MRPSAQQILNAFIANSYQQQTHVGFGKRGSLDGDDGYIHVWGPNADLNNKKKGLDDCHINIECRHDCISITEQLANALGAHARLRGSDYSAGPSNGRFTWEFVPNPGDSADAIVCTLIKAFSKAGLIW